MNLIQTYGSDSAADTRTVTGLVLGVVLVIILATILVMWVAAIVSIVRSTYSGGMKAVFVLAVLALPIAGSLAWFAVMKKNQPSLTRPGAPRQHW